MAIRPNKPAVKKSSYEFLVSACLAGANCTYRGKNKLSVPIKELVDSGKAIAVCPEVMGGLPIPRENSEIAGGDGLSVLRRKAAVMSVSGIDLSENYVAGARRVLSLAKKYTIKKAILKSKSPACGFGMIYDGTFTRTLKKGDGVLACLLRVNGIAIHTERYKLKRKT